MNFLFFFNSLKSLEIKSDWFKRVDGQDELLLVCVKSEEMRPVCMKDISEMTQDDELEAPLFLAVKILAHLLFGSLMYRYFENSESFTAACKY